MKSGKFEIPIIWVIFKLLGNSVPDFEDQLKLVRSDCKTGQIHVLSFHNIIRKFYRLCASKNI